MSPSARTPQEEQHYRLVAAMYERVLQPLDSSRVDEFFRSDYIQHSPLAATGARGLKDFLDWARARSPNAEHRVKRLFVDGDYVIAHVHVIINPGERGNAVVDIFRIVDGRIAEHWDVAQEVPATSANENGVF
jgi:predicted SnoaL-like aldol condensation-catalyzing enzyme